VLPGINHHAYQIGGVLDPSSWYGTLLTGMFNITAEPTVLEVIAWIAYGIPVLVLFLWPMKKAAKPSKPAEVASPA
jgi:high-affinity iron transporter